MKIKNIFTMLSLIMLVGVLPAPLHAEENNGTPDKLAVLWTSGDPEVANNVAFMYTHTAKKVGWFKEVTLIVWGPSQRLLVNDKSLQEKVKAMQKDGVVVEACIACAMGYGIVEDLKKLGITVKGMGEPLSNYLKSDWKVLTF